MGNKKPLFNKRQKNNMKSKKGRISRHALSSEKQIEKETKI